MSTRHYYYWLVAKGEDGKPYLIFGCDSIEGEEKARQRGLELLQGMDFEIKRYPTKDLGQASAYFRGKRLESGEGLSKARQRIGHERSINQLARKRAARSARRFNDMGV